MSIRLFWGVLVVTAACTSASTTSSSGGTRGKPPAVTLPAYTSYVVVYADGLELAAHKWADYRRSTGENVRILPYRDIAGTPPSLETARAAVFAAFEIPRGTVASTKFSDRKLLLLGDGGVDLAPTASLPYETSTVLVDASGVPSVGDNIWAESDSESKYPLFAVGRIPARSDATALAVLDKIKRYEAAPDGEWQHRMGFIAGEGRFGKIMGMDVDRVLEQLFAKFADERTPPIFDLEMTYANPKSKYAYPPRLLTQHVAESIQSGSLFFAYLGHGQVESFDHMAIPSRRGGYERFKLFDRSSVGALREPRSELPIMMVVACQTGAFDYQRGNSVAEELLFAPGGPVALIAGSRDVHPYGNALYYKAFAESMMAGVATLSEPLLVAKRYLIDPNGRDRQMLDGLAKVMVPGDLSKLAKTHLVLYNLLGDPGLRVRSPKRLPADSIDGLPDRVDAGGTFTVAIRVPSDFQAAAARYTIKTPPSVTRSRSGAIDYQVLLHGDPERSTAERDKLIAQHRDVNDKRVVGPVDIPLRADHRGRVSMTVRVPKGLASGRYLLTVALEGRQREGQSGTFFGGWAVNVAN